VWYRERREGCGSVRVMWMGRGREGAVRRCVRSDMLGVWWIGCRMLPTNCCCGYGLDTFCELAFTVGVDIWCIAKCVGEISSCLAAR
jgi:hypothetical protein